MSKALSLYDMLFQMNEDDSVRVQPTWDNVISALNNNVQEHILSAFFNHFGEQLIQIDKQKVEPKKKLYKDELEKIIYRNNMIDNDNYRKLTGYLSFVFTTIFEELPIERIHILIQNKNIEVNDQTIQYFLNRIERNEEKQIIDKTLLSILVDLFYSQKDPNSALENLDIFINSIVKARIDNDVKLILVETYFSLIDQVNINQAVEKLLSNVFPYIDYEIKNKILEKQSFILDNLDKLNDAEANIDGSKFTIFTNLFSKNKIKATWENLLEYVKCTKNNKVISDFVVRHYRDLIVSIENLDLTNSSHKNFVDEYLINNDSLKDSVYIELIKALDLKKDTPFGSQLNIKKITLLVQSNLLSASHIDILHQKKESETEERHKINELIINIIASGLTEGYLETQDVWQYLRYRNNIQPDLVTQYLQSKIALKDKLSIFIKVIDDYSSDSSFISNYPLKAQEVINYMKFVESDETRLLILNTYFTIFEPNYLIDALNTFDDERYHHLAPDGTDKRPKFFIKPSITTLLNNLLQKKYISDKSLENKGGEYHVRKLTK
ncbi:hypothetical protein PE074_09995 (plasmid) [Wohlfahrtiimonas chitiniclastica]|uniref:hypothetical protein n=1 Tax=Wohlfahrtiimonas chitiniclastica TaxID=400946 RepID=UPI0007B40D0A|nr:hypothetical protein [Wohlfahrtiimonas chitiniclastica]KZS22129.1 hypothetical protein BMY_2141 [Wohlfahrtiimonas chitiniclastica]WHR56430.1 hypothetical protein PE074_09995 [Wohlfahrtiimonas chitiniclastica]